MYLHLLLACTAARSAVPLAFTRVADIEQATAIVEPPRGPGGLYVVEQEGRIWRLDPDKEGDPALVLDIRERLVSGGEMGLLGLAFAPRYPEDPRIFVNYTYEDDRDQLHTRIASYVVSADGATADPASEAEVLTFEQPYANHNSGALAVGPDGMLYIGVGDGGSGGDPQNHAQDRTDWLGSILRIDVTTAPYTVPADNPFVQDGPSKPEIWAYGVRNPWGMHFDGETLWFADVGQDAWEEIDRGVKGGNYGWRVMEGTHCFETKDCDPKAFVAPVAEYSHEDGQSVTGGFVYRGPSIPALDGKYVFADYVSGNLWTLPTNGGRATLLGDIDKNPSSFGYDRKGRMYVGDYGKGVFRVDP